MIDPEARINSELYLKSCRPCIFILHITHIASIYKRSKIASPGLLDDGTHTNQKNKTQNTPERLSYT